MWQVSEATIKRWADAGHLHSQKTLGGHRRFAFAEVLRFQSERGLADRIEESRAAYASAMPGMSSALAQGDAFEVFFEAIASGHEGEATAVLLRSYLDRMPPVLILEETVARALHRVGDLWQSGEMSIADEHLATRTSMRAIESLRSAIRPPPTGGQKVAICCTVEDELHDIATLCVQVLLESEGWSVSNLGANMPFFALSDAVTKHRPRLVCISSTACVALSKYARDYAQFQTIAGKHQTRIALGGEGFLGEAMRQKFPADLHAENFKQLLEFIRS